MLFCADILGRYYTDMHIVDEDLTAISSVGGAWIYKNLAGIANRELSITNGTTSTINTVASRLIYLS